MIMRKKIFLLLLVSVALSSCSRGNDKENRELTAEMAYEGVNNYCHSEYDWSVAKDNPSIMGVEKAKDMDSVYQVVFRSYTGASVYFYVNKASGVTRMVERVPALGVESEAGTINVYDYLKKEK